MSSQEELNDKLIEAVEAGDLEEVRRLLASGADVNARDKCTREGFGFDRGNDPVETALICAVRNDNLPVARLLLESGADPNCWTYGDTDSAVQLAVSDNSLEMVKLLLDNGADVNWAPMGDNCLMSAYYHGYREMFDYLLEHGADPNKKTFRGENFYQYAELLRRERWIEPSATQLSDSGTPGQHILGCLFLLLLIVVIILKICGQILSSLAH